MKKLFKSIDDKLKEIGFNKIKEDKNRVEYERYISDFDYTQVLSINYKISGKHLIQSYDKDLCDDKYIGNVGVGLTYDETKLILKKMKQWKRKYGIR